MTRTFRCLTTTREDVFAIGHLLAAVFRPEALLDATSPLLFKVNGSLSSGKSIIFDTVRNDLLGADAVFTGDKGFDEYWQGRNSGRVMELSFLDAAHNFYGNAQLNNRTGREDTFLSTRQRGGISFIQNSSTPEAADVSLWLEAPAIYWTEEVNTEPVVGRRRLPDDLRPAFQQAHQKTRINDRSWVRYIEISVHNPAVIDVAALEKGMKKLTRQFNKEARKLLQPAAPTAGVQQASMQGPRI